MEAEIAKFVVGIDLGTTNCAVALADAHAEKARTVDFDVRQVTHAATHEERPVLPSFLYLPGAHELPAGSLTLPWNDGIGYCVGEFAREQGARIPQRVVSSAKSWLCFDGADRRGPILPWKAPDDVARVSPVEVSARYLAHMRDAWNSSHADAPMEAQEIILTVPASFDAVARELTAEAARECGFLHLTLLEEPQAALYSWLEVMGEKWREHLKVGDLILVCDVGGGTTDFSLIEVAEENGSLSLDRIAVGEHILLGGDNMDLALAVHVQNLLRNDGHKIDNWQFLMLVHACRAVKERLLDDGSIDAMDVTIEGRGTKLIGGSITARLSRADVERVIVDGFFPLCASTDGAVRARRAGFAELGLPFESDAAISRHLASFLSSAKSALKKVPKGHTFAHPNVVLFNGGVMKAALLRQRVIELLDGWLTKEKSAATRQLASADLDRAVARGAAHYGRVRNGKGIRIRGGTSRAYYVGVEVARPAIPGLPPPIKAVCVAPLGMEEGTQSDLPAQDFGLVVGEPAEFRFLATTARRDDKVGTTLEAPDEIDALEEIATLSVELDASKAAGQLVPVRLRSVATEVGTLELWCVEQKGEGRWKLEFNVREKQPAGV